MWLERMEKSPPFIEAWLTHQRRDAYWKHGSVCEDYAAIDTPVYLVGGWSDAYRNAILRLLAGLPGPKKGLVGPWSHNYPEQGVPGPAIGFLQECLRWWDYWLKGIETGIMDEPLLRVWMQEAVEPRPHHAERPGRWVAEPSWPSPSIETRSVQLDFPASEIRGAQAAGLEAGDWCPFGSSPVGASFSDNAGDWPPNQRAEDGLSLCFTSEPLAEPLEILGFPEVTLNVASDRPNALVAVRLCDVASTGASLLVTRGLLNLTHRESHEELTPLVPGERYTVTVRLNAIAHAFPAGHRLRVAISPTYWPWAWPSPEPVTLAVFGDPASRLELPMRPPRPEDAQLPPFEPPEGAPELEVETFRAPAGGRILRRDVAAGRFELVCHRGLGARLRLASGLEYEERNTDTFSIVEDDPLSARVTCEWTIAVGRGDWRTRVETTSTMSADADSFRVTNVLDGFEGNTRVFARTWSFTIPRDRV